MTHDRYGIHKSSSILPILSQNKAAHAIPTNSLKIHFNIIFSLTINSSEWSLLQVSRPNPAHTSLLPHMRHTPRPVPFSFDNPSNNWREVQLTKSLTPQLRPVPR